MWTHAALNSNGAMEALVGENYCGMMDLVPGREGPGKAGQTDEQVDETSAWHIQIQVSFSNRAHHIIIQDETSEVNGSWTFLTSNFHTVQSRFSMRMRLLFKLYLVHSSSDQMG